MNHRHVRSVLSPGLKLGFFTLILVFACGAALAEPVVVKNGAEPAEGMVQVAPKELWRAGGEDDDIFFGSVARIVTDPQGNTFLLDGQLSEVHIYSPDGEWITRIGREGDGPGEVRRPSDMFLADDGTVCLLQGFPGKIVKLTPDGTPAGEVIYQAGDAGQGQFSVMIRGLNHPKGMALGGIRMTFGGGSVSDQVYFFSLCDDEGLQQKSLLSKEHSINYADFELDELSMDFVWSRMAAGKDGSVVFAPDFDSMNLMVYDPAGELKMAIEREYTPLPRNEEQSRIARQIIEAIGANYPAPPKRITIEDHQPAIIGMWITGDSRILVQPTVTDGTIPDGCWAVLDEYSAKGIYTRRIALKGDFDVNNDGLFLQPDGRLFVVVGALDAFLNQQAVSSEEGDAVSEEESSPLEVICYRLDLDG